MTINKNTDLEFSLQQKTEKGAVYTNFYTGDKGSASIRIRLSSNEYFLDLTKTDLKPVLFLFHEDGSIFEIKDFINVMPDKGLIQYNLSDNVIAHAGKVKAKLFLKNTEQSVHVANFTFDIKDSEVEGAIAKEISVNIVDDAVRRIVKENAIEILGDDFEQRLNTDVINHLDSNAELFKGDKGEQGSKGDKGDKGDKGIDGQDGVIRFEDLAPEQKELFTKGQVILEHPIKGYPPRHDISYVTWIGVNEPQEAEVFDEWRQIPGFVYFTDFHTVNDWVKKDTDILNVEKVLDDNEDAMLIDTRGASRKSLLWDNVKTTKDLEIYFSGKKGNSVGGQTISALLKYTNEELIFCGPFDKELRVTKVNLITGVSTVLYKTTHNVDLNKKFHLIARIDGNSFKGKIWQDGIKEPKDWQINGNSDEVVVESQNVGIYTFIYGKDIIYKFGVGTNGMRAPHREVY